MFLMQEIRILQTELPSLPQKVIAKWKEGKENHLWKGKSYNLREKGIDSRDDEEKEEESFMYQMALENEIDEVYD